MEATLETNIAGWNAAFREYAKATSLQPQEALEKRLSNLGQALYKGFRAHQFGGDPKRKGVSMSELAQRTANGRGTELRSTLLAEYQKTRDQLRAKARSLKKSLKNFGGTLDQWSGTQSAIAENQAQRISAWQTAVGIEINKRQQGIGQLAAAFLWYRWRGKGKGRRVVPNRKGQTMGSVDIDSGVALVTARVEGINRVDARYGVVAKAIHDDTDDTLAYIKRNQDQETAKILGSFI